MEIRIYCTCGQKMRVSDAMFGRPGKCIACRQKIRIPRADEIPEGETEIHIKDHPELLRKSRRHGSSRTPAGDQANENSRKSSKNEGQARRESVPVPLDVYEPLRTLCCLQRKIDRQTQSLSGDGKSEDVRHLLREGDRLASLRTELNEALTRSTGETAAELAGVNDRIEKAEASLRAGEGVFAELRTFLDALRNRREILERWTCNLAGWRQLTDPHMAGGYINLPLEHAPTDIDLPQPPSELPEGSMLLDHYIEALREALTQRDQATRELDELHQAKREASLTPMALEDIRNDHDAARRRADALILFLRERLGQLGNDYAQDAVAIQAESDRVRRRFYDRLIDEASFKSLERNLQRMKEDSGKAGAIITRALIASSSGDVPHPRRTFLQRLAPGRQDVVTDTEADQWVVWFSALLMGASVFLPINSSFSVMTAFQNPDFRSEPSAWALLLPILLGMAAAMAAAIPWRASRGIMVGLLGALCLFLTATVIHESRYSTGLLAAAFWSESTSWMLRPGVIICVLGQIGILVASLIGLSPYRRMARWYWVGFGSLMALIFLTTTNYLGIFTPGPSLTLETNISPGTAELVVSVYNRGNRDLILTRARGHLSNTFICSVNAVGEQGSSRPVPAPVSTEVFGGNALAARSGGTQIHPNGFVRMHYRLPGGEYEALLAEAAPNAQPFERQSITIEVPPPPPEPTPASTLNDDGLPGAVTTAPLPEPPRFGDAENPANSEGEPPPPPPPPGTRVLLRGVVAAPESTPKVSITVFLPNMAPNLKNIAMGEAVVGPWKAQEYNPQLQTVTISDGTRMLVLRKGELILL